MSLKKWGAKIEAIDRWIYTLERWFVVIGLMLMAEMIFLEIFHLAMISEGSRIGRFTLQFLERWTGQSWSEFAEQSWNYGVELFEGAVVVLAIVYAVRMKTQRHWMQWSLLLILGLFLLAYLVGHAPSWVSYTLIYLMVWGMSWYRWKKSSLDLGALRFRTWIALSIVGIFYMIWVFHLPQDYSFAQHMALFLLLWVAFVGASMATYEKGHLGIDFIRKYLSQRRGYRIYEMSSLLVTWIFTLLFLWVAWDYVFNPVSGARTWRTHEGAIPHWIKVLAIPMALITMSLRLTKQWIKVMVSLWRGEA